ncbi:MAG: extracellular solute-binding protein [Gaiellaceae bacterium MAG52_C11]|nr:extracellular solute-binding protein [Candidatus Gaiellasilicea maunaloa]
MQSLSKRTIGVLVVIAAVLVTMLVVAGPTAAAAETKIRVWTDKDRKAAVEKVVGAWAASKGLSVEVLEKDFGKIRDDLKTVQPESAPDVIIGAHDWTGQLAADGLVLPLFPTKATRAQFPSYALSAFSYGTAVTRLYAAPVALENIALVVNTKLVKVPKTFAEFQASALAFKKKANGNLAVAVPQGAAGDAYHMYPFFSGLGGYVFGRNKAGNLDPSDIGVANKTFLSNASQIDAWNKSGFLNSKIDYGVAKDSFLKGKAAFWITGPWEADTLRTSKLSYKIVQVPSNKFKSVPFLGVQGFMVTKFATTHGLESAAKDLVGSYMMRPDGQAALAAANGRFPANMVAGKAVKNPLLAQFGKAGVGGVPMPNIPQMSSVWSDLASAWVKSTKGSGASKARTAFATAARNIANKIG